MKLAFRELSNQLLPISKEEGDQSDGKGDGKDPALESDPPKTKETKPETAEQKEARLSKKFEGLIQSWSTCLRADEARARLASRQLREAGLKHAEGHLAALSTGANVLRDKWMKLESMFEENETRTLVLEFMKTCSKELAEIRDDIHIAEARIDPTKANAKSKKVNSKNKDPLTEGFIDLTMQDFTAEVTEGVSDNYL